MKRFGLGHPIVLIGVLVLLAGAIALAALISQAWAGSAFITADGGINTFIGYKQQAEVVNGLGAGLAYRPTEVNRLGVEDESPLLFVASYSQADRPYSQIEVLYRFRRGWGVDFFAGPGVMAIEEAGSYSLGPIGEIRMEFYTGNNPMQLLVGSGYIWRTATPENPCPNPVPFYVKLGIRTQ